jgi:gamma-glutamyl:cysteine ligase YbdK (ATP-grasp superfamily)
MGQEIADSHFSQQDFDAFGERLREETELLKSWFRDGVFSETSGKGGFELEAWLVDREAEPAGINQAYLERLDNPLVVPELATFNVELNNTPLMLQGDALSRMAQELESTWVNCNRVAEELGARLGMIGILPTLQRYRLNPANMSPLQRYRALNEQVLRQRAGCPIELHIDGRDRLDLQHADVMLESAATSFQIHLQASPRRMLRIYNASKLLAAPMVAACANSPFLFGRDLWDETRIPLFEQAVAVGRSDLTKRVSFGIRYAEYSILECFLANQARYPVLLPHLMDEPRERLAHLRLHNGTIWRWNRPLVGFDADGTPHLRMEHRVVPSGPSVPDSIANAALYFGAVQALADRAEPVERRLAFDHAKGNFYTAARDGLRAEITWLDHCRVRLDELLLQELLPAARSGLARLGVDADEVRHWLGIIEQRVRGGRTGAAWQRAAAVRLGGDLRAMTQEYLAQQALGKPVHEWP